MATRLNDSSDNDQTISFCDRYWICSNYSDEENYGNCVCQDIKPYDKHPEECRFFRIDERKIKDVDYRLRTIGLAVCYLDKTNYRPFHEPVIHRFDDDRTGDFNSNIGGKK